jgi:hypothetical protein
MRPSNPAKGDESDPFCPVFSVIVKKVPNALFQALDTGEIDLEDLPLRLLKRLM